MLRYVDQIICSLVVDEIALANPKLSQFLDVFDHSS
jgi:hypothetical protein